MRAALDGGRRTHMSNCTLRAGKRDTHEPLYIRLVELVLQGEGVARLRRLRTNIFNVNISSGKNKEPLFITYASLAKAQKTDLRSPLLK